jgi:hypothetical protein
MEISHPIPERTALPYMTVKMESSGPSGMGTIPI